MADNEAYDDGTTTPVEVSMDPAQMMNPTMAPFIMPTPPRPDFSGLDTSEALKKQIAYYFSDYNLYKVWMVVTLFSTQAYLDIYLA